MTEEEAVKLYDGKFWESMSYRDRAKFQINTKLLCMPFDILHEAVTKTLGRPVFIHEFAFPSLKKEINGEIGPPSFEEIMNLIPAEKRIIIGL